jgi:la-related protein 1
MWAKGQRQPTSIIPNDADELYLDVRARALKNRELSIPGETHPDMKLLYEFWSHFLCRNFNPTMYFEFRNCALADAEKNAMDGLRSLISYYDETLNNRKKVIPDGLACHYVDLVKLEKITTDPGSDRPAFTKLRAAWRNGALDLKSRKKIDNLVDGILREELER